MGNKIFKDILILKLRSEKELYYPDGKTKLKRIDENVEYEFMEGEEEKKYFVYPL